MSYRLLAISPASIWMGDKLHQVNAGDTLHLPKPQAQYLLSSEYASSFIVTDMDDPTEPKQTADGGFFSSISSAETIPSSEGALFAPPVQPENPESISVPGTPDVYVDPFQAAYDEYAEGVELPKADDMIVEETVPEEVVEETVPEEVPSKPVKKGKQAAVTEEV